MRKSHVAICVFIMLSVVMSSSACDRDSRPPGETEDVYRPISTQEPASTQEATPLVSQLSSPFSQIYGTWKITGTIGSGYIFSDSVPEEVYIDGILTIRDDFIECKLPDSKQNKSLNLSGSLNNPVYITKMQGRNAFFSRRYADYDSFGFESGEKVPYITVRDGREDWDNVASDIWIKDKDHIIIEGPQYFLAEKVE